MKIFDRASGRVHEAVISKVLNSFSLRSSSLVPTILDMKKFKQMSDFSKSVDANAPYYKDLQYPKEWGSASFTALQKMIETGNASYRNILRFDAKIAVYNFPEIKSGDDIFIYCLAFFIRKWVLLFKMHPNKRYP